MATYLNMAQILVSLALVFAVLFQVKGGGLGGVFGSPETVFRTRRGIEKTLLQFTLVLIVLFVVVSVLSVRLHTAA
ncbi:MAG: preprotein translocase subunit SecG [Chloroflexi bacterium]|nr:preprotein translocase subunit SecG [Chloroflexota bacterium]